MKASVDRTSIGDQVKDILMEQILTGQLKAGDRIKELHIANDLGISQAPVREAIRWLEAAGYVEHIPHAGVRVRKYDFRELIEVYQVRELLETHAIKLAINSLKTSEEYESHIAALEGALREMEEASRHKDKPGYAKHDTDFHRLILKMAGNRVMLTMWESLKIQSRVLNTMFGTTQSVGSAVKLHRPIISAIRARDVELGCERISEHYDFFRKYHEAAIADK